MKSFSEQQQAAQWLARVSLALTAMVFAAFGFLFLVWPGAIELTGVELTTSTAAVEIRGFYGGMEIGLAIFFALAASRPSWFRAGLTAQIASLGGMALGRVFGIAVGDGADALIYALITAESAGCLFGLFALWRLGMQVQPSPS